jgi:hypothetical protein
MLCGVIISLSLSLSLSLSFFLTMLFGLVYQGKDIVFRFIIESSSLRDFAFSHKSLKELKTHLSSSCFCMCVFAPSKFLKVLKLRLFFNPKFQGRTNNTH